MYDLFLISNRLPDIILTHPVITVFETLIDDAVLKLYQPFFFTEVLMFSKLKQCNKLFGPGGIRLDVLNFKR